MCKYGDLPYILISVYGGGGALNPKCPRPPQGLNPALVDDCLCKQNTVEVLRIVTEGLDQGLDLGVFGNHLTSKMTLVRQQLCHCVL